MKKLLLLIIIPFLSFGQGWEQTYGSDWAAQRGTSVQQSSDGGYIVGASWSNENLQNPQNLCMFKTDQSGNIDWVVREGYSYPSVFAMISAFESLNDGYVMISTDEDGQNIIIVKSNDNGEIEWITEPFFSCGFNGSQTSGYSFQQTADGGYIISGEYFCPYIDGDFYFLMKFNENGDQQWTQLFNMYDFDFETGDFVIYTGFYSLQETSDGGYVGIRIATYSDADTNSSASLVKLNSEGIEQWEEVIGTETSGFGVSFSTNLKLITTIDDGFMIVVTDINNLVSLIKLDSFGNQEWSQVYSEDYAPGPHKASILQTNDGGYVLSFTKAGFIGLDFSTWKICLIKIDQYGEQEWLQLYGDDNNETLVVDVKQTLDDGFIITGGTDIDSSMHILLIKTDSEGNVSSTNIIEIPTIKKSLITTVDILGRETNNNEGFQLEIYDDGSVEVKYLIK